MTTMRNSPVQGQEGKARRVVIAGGGVAALETMLALRELAGPRVDVEVLAPNETFGYRPMDVAQPFGRGGVRQLDLAELVQAGGARHTAGALRAVDPKRRVVETAEGAAVAYDALVVCTGAHAVPVVDDALTFRGQPDLEAFQALLSEVNKPSMTLAFVLPPGASWALPLYELAFLTAGELASQSGYRRTELVIVTHEQVPLEMFGVDVSRAVTVLLEREGIALRTGVEVASYKNGVLWLSPQGELEADRVVAMPRLLGPAIPGLPHDDDGFLPIDEFGRVEGVCDVYAAGDATNYPVKQGGLGTQQADAAAASIAAWAGASVEPEPFRAMLRGQLLTHGASRFLEIDLGDSLNVSRIGFTPPGWQNAKIVARYLTPFLAERGVGTPDLPQPPVSSTSPGL